MRDLGVIALMAGLAMIASVGLACGEETDGESWDGSADDDDDVDPDEVSSNQADSPPPSTRPNEECAELADAPDAHKACRDCVTICNYALQSGLGFQDEQCIAEQIIENWACEVTVFDGVREDNSCASFPETAPNRVTVDEGCGFVSTSVVY